jgi:hypothetical protein
VRCEALRLLVQSAIPWQNIGNFKGGTLAMRMHLKRHSADRDGMRRAQ